MCARTHTHTNMSITTVAKFCVFLVGGGGFIKEAFPVMKMTWKKKNK